MKIRILALTGAFGIFSSSMVWAHTHHSEKTEASLRGTPTTSSLFNLKDSWTNQDRIQQSLSAFAGHPIVLAMIYTSCKDTCPLIVATMREVEKDLSPELKEKTRFLLFSFDEARDTPEKLKIYAKSQSLNPEHWTLFHGRHSAIQNLAAALGIKYKRLKSGDFEHSNLITFLNPKGEIIRQETTSKLDPKEAAEVLGKQ